MNVKPGSIHDLVEEWGVTGATLGVKLVLNDDSTDAIPRTTGFVEIGTSGIYRLTDFGPFPDEEGDYTLVFNDDGTTYDPAHVSTREVVITSSAPVDAFDGDSFGTTEELFRRLKIRNPTEAQTDNAERLLIAATGDIMSEIDLPDDVSLAGWQVVLATEVCYERAAELWAAGEVPGGLVGLDIGVPTRLGGTKSWERYAEMLAPLKGQWGIA